MLLLKMILACVQFFAFIGYGVTMKHAIFKRKTEKYLPDSVITTKYAESELECSMHCTSIDACLTVNYKTSGVDQGLCQLNNRTTLENLGLVSDDRFVHLSLIKRVRPHGGRGGGGWEVDVVFSKTSSRNLSQNNFFVNISKIFSEEIFIFTKFCNSSMHARAPSPQVGSPFFTFFWGCYPPPPPGGTALGNVRICPYTCLNFFTHIISIRLSQV
jgi:hypothetical protein